MKIKQLRHELESYNQDADVFVFLKEYIPSANAYDILGLLVAWTQDDKPCIMIDVEGRK